MSIFSCVIQTVMLTKKIHNTTYISINSNVNILVLWPFQFGILNSIRTVRFIHTALVFMLECVCLCTCVSSQFILRHSITGYLSWLIIVMNVILELNNCRVLPVRSQQLSKLIICSSTLLPYDIFHVHCYDIIPKKCTLLCFLIQNGSEWFTKINQMEWHNVTL